MANYTLTTSAQEVGRNTAPTVGARMLAWYTNATASGATVHLKLQAISQGLTYTGTNKDYQLALDSTDTGTVAWSYAPLPADTWVDVVEITQYIAFGRTVSILGKVWTYLYDDAWITGNTVTLAAPYVAPTTPTISSSALTSNSVAITYGTTSFGTPSTGTVTLYGGTTANPTTVLDTYNATGDHTFTHTGLTPGTTYYYRARANNGQLNSNYSTEISVTTNLPYGFYGSVNGQTKRVTKMYGPVDVTTTTVTGVIRAGGVGNIASFDGNTFWNYASPSLNYTDVKAIGVTNQTFSWRIFVQYVDANHGSQVLDSSISTSNLQNYGITPISGSTTAGTDYIDVTITTTTNSVSKEIIKMYGPVQVAEQYSITPDGLVVTAIDGELLCATAKGQYPSTYMNAVTFEFGLDSLYYARGFDSNNNQVFYRSGSASGLASAGVTFSPSVTSGVSTTLPATYVPAASVAKRIF